MARKMEVVELSNNYFDSANEYNKRMMQEYLDNAIELSDKTLINYTSAARIWVCYINKFLNNKKFTEIKPMEFKMYLNWLAKLGIYDANIKVKRSVVSNINEHIILYHNDEPDVTTFRNYITKAIKTPMTGKKFEKNPLTDEEYKKLCDWLEEKKQWQQLAYLKFSYVSGCRKNEARFLLKEVVNYKPIEKITKIKNENGNIVNASIKKYKTHPIKCKGKKSDAARKLTFDDDAMKYLKKWLEERGEDNCPYMFVIKKGEIVNQVSKNTFNYWCIKFEEYIGKHIFPHLIRTTRASSLKLQGKNIEAIQQLLGHKSSDTTKVYIVNEDNDDEDELFTI